jgi:hypothetical protein
LAIAYPSSKKTSFIVATKILFPIPIIEKGALLVKKLSCQVDLFADRVALKLRAVGSILPFFSIRYMWLLERYPAPSHMTIAMLKWRQVCFFMPKWARMSKKIGAQRS